MKALTVQQPWAWAIMHGGKLVENRTQLWGYRGILAIHAGARRSERGMQDPRILQAARSSTGPTHPDLEPHLQYGAILGLIEVIHTHPATANCCPPWGETEYVEHGGRHRRNVVHMVLENPQPLPEPIACRGALGLWTVPGDIERRCHEQLHL